MNVGPGAATSTGHASAQISPLFAQNCTSTNNQDVPSGAAGAVDSQTQCVNEVLMSLDPKLIGRLFCEDGPVANNSVTTCKSANMGLCAGPMTVVSSTQSSTGGTTGQPKRSGAITYKPICFI